MQDVLPSLNKNEQTNLSKTKNNHHYTSFFDLLEKYDFPQPRQGDIIKGEIMRIDDDVVFIDIGSKRDAMVPYREIAQLEDDFLETLTTGDTVPVYVTRTPVGSEQLLVSLERGLQELDWERASEIHQEDKTIELKIANYNKGGLVVEFGRIQGFVPNSHIPSIQHVYAHDERTSYKSKIVGETIKVKILEIDPEQERFVLSARLAQKEQRQARLESLSIGERVRGTVVNLKHYGAFLDIGDGLVGLLHISQMAWEHIAHPQEIFAVGDQLDVLIDKVDVAREKISLNRKALLPSPWDLFAENWATDDLLEGQVTAVVDFGVFVRVMDGIEGLLHRNEMTLPNNANPSDLLTVGDTVLVRILNIDVEQQRLGLSTRRVTAAEEIEWMQDKRAEKIEAVENHAAASERAENVHDAMLEAQTLELENMEKREEEIAVDEAT